MSVLNLEVRAGFAKMQVFGHRLRNVFKTRSFSGEIYFGAGFSIDGTITSSWSFPTITDIFLFLHFYRQIEAVSILISF